MSENRIAELRARNHDLANEVMQERAKRMQAEADAAAMKEALKLAINFVVAGRFLSDEDRTLISNAMDAEHPGASLLAVAQAAADFVEAGEYDDLASLLLELKEKIKEWER